MASMNMLEILLEYSFAANLYRIRGGPLLHPYYLPGIIGRFADFGVEILNAFWLFKSVTLPLVFLMTYALGACGILADFITKAIIASGCGSLVLIYIRAMCRGKDYDYREFAAILEYVRGNPTLENKRLLKDYEVQFTGLPVDYSYQHIRSLSRYQRTSSHIIIRATPQKYLFNLLYKILGYLIVKIFGIFIVYPEALPFIQASRALVLFENRCKIQDKYDGERLRLMTGDGNNIDAMLVDRREEAEVNPNSKYLIICCEGCKGYYERGLMRVPLGAGYSVLGWNRPGYGHSTGTPYPDQEQFAMEIIMEYVLNKLRFDGNNIILYATDLGAYIAGWAIYNYPMIKGAVLDGVSEDIIPLSYPFIPKRCKSLFRVSLRQYFNFNLYGNLKSYNGGVLFIRRTHDEILSINDDITTNGTNFLLLKFLRYRYPYIFGVDQVRLARLIVLQMERHEENPYRYIHDEICEGILQIHVDHFSKLYPMVVGQELSENTRTNIALFLLNRYLVNFEADHGAWFPSEAFDLPWDIVPRDMMTPSSSETSLVPVSQQPTNHAHD